MASSPRPRMSRAVPVALLSGIAITLVACGPDRRCVDDNNLVVDETHCQTNSRTSAGHGTHWYYGGTAIGGGRIASGGSFTNPSDSGNTVSNSAARSATGGGTVLAEPSSGTSNTGAVSRGGLGATASSHGSSSGS